MIAPLRHRLRRRSPAACRHTLLLLLAAAAEEHREHCDELAFAYFAVSTRRLPKAKRSARSAKAAHPQAHTVLITDAKGASHVKKEATCDNHGIVFDYVDVLGRGGKRDIVQQHAGISSGVPHVPEGREKTRVEAQALDYRWGCQ